MQKPSSPFALLLAFLVAPASAAEPLKDFEAIVARCKSNYTAPFSEVTKLPSSDKWVKRMTWPGDVEYDVKKTDSLVSPFIAFISIKTLVAGRPADSEESAKAIEVSQDAALARRETRISFSYQSGVWLANEAVERTSIRLGAGEQYQAPVSINISKDELLRPFNPTERCLRTQ